MTSPCHLQQGLNELKLAIWGFMSMENTLLMSVLHNFVAVLLELGDLAMSSATRQKIDLARAFLRGREAAELYLAHRPLPARVPCPRNTARPRSGRASGARRAQKRENVDLAKSLMSGGRPKAARIPEV